MTEEMKQEIKGGDHKPLSDGQYQVIRAWLKAPMAEYIHDAQDDLQAAAFHLEALLNEIDRLKARYEELREAGETLLDSVLGHDDIRRFVEVVDRHQESEAANGES